MSNQPAAASPLRISSLHKRYVGRKLRLAGRLLSIDIQSQLLLLLDESTNACLANVALCTDPLRRVPELLDGKSIITVVGYLEWSRTELPIPTIPTFVDAPDVDAHLYLQAILLVPTPDLDLKLWNEGIQVKEEAGMHEVHPLSI